MAATKLVLLLTLLYIVKIELVIAQAICGGGCQGYGYCGGVYPTVVDTNDNDPLDVILPVLLLAIINRNGVNGAGALNNLNGGNCDSGVTPVNGCCGNGGNSYNNCGCSNSCGVGCNSGCNAGCCNNNGCPGPVATAITTGLSNGCCGGCC